MTGYDMCWTLASGRSLQGSTPILVIDLVKEVGEDIGRCSSSSFLCVGVTSEVQRLDQTGLGWSGSVGEDPQGVLRNDVTGQTDMSSSRLKVHRDLLI